MVTEKDLVWSHGVHLACCTSEAWAQIIFDEPWITGSVLRVNLQENHGNPDISWGKPWFLVSIFPTNPLNGILAKPIFTHTHSLFFFCQLASPGVFLGPFHRHFSSFYDHFPQLTWQKIGHYSPMRTCAQALRSFSANHPGLTYCIAGVTIWRVALKST